ncbi:hypothetical protein BBK82_05045 [Lentzea guizhouensis]|uniref:DUF3040 domain-containing protein n=1 Tax=Lentzea guizhouensis TaxID=1586287 RepID=A0A1B2HCU3_9PSEU|nr:hypothetical protein [Lentzea guizhouensis]ANZ35540.1 hypothetical protein BBK82_05045 [Lentzea guizhouensis]
MPGELAVPHGVEDAPRERGRLAELVDRAQLDRWDYCCAVGLLCLLLGLSLAVGTWLGVAIGIGVALTVFGGLVLALGITGARQQPVVDELQAGG